MEKPRLHIRFLHMFSALRWFFLLLNLIDETQVINMKLQRNAENEFKNRMCKLGLS